MAQRFNSMMAQLQGAGLQGYTHTGPLLAATDLTFTVDTPTVYSLAVFSSAGVMLSTYEATISYSNGTATIVLGASADLGTVTVRVVHL